MANDEEHLEGNTPSISIRGPPGRPYKMTIELPLFLCILGLSLSGKISFLKLLINSVLSLTNKKNLFFRFFIK